ncbi:MAG: DUF1080 domain-containing protein, partial [Anaerolinea sp.]|nr:DUF1080 domain-containing protein [Anaerolinea sp.]
MARRSLIVLIPALMAVALAAAHRLLPVEYVVDGQGGAILFIDGFDDAPLFNAFWDQYDDGQLSASIHDSGLTLRIDRAGAAAFSRAHVHFRDFDLRVRLMAVDGPIDNGYGVIFRFQDNDNNLIADDRYYAFQISSDGYYRLVSRTTGEEREISTWIPSAIVRPGLNVSNEIRVTAQGDRFQFFVNDQIASLCIPDNPAGRSVYFMDTCR